MKKIFSVIICMITLVLYANTAYPEESAEEYSQLISDKGFMTDKGQEFFNFNTIYNPAKEILTIKIYDGDKYFKKNKTVACRIIGKYSNDTNYNPYEMYDMRGYNTGAYLNDIIGRVTFKKDSTVEIKLARELNNKYVFLQIEYDKGAPGSGRGHAWAEGFMPNKRSDERDIWLESLLPKYDPDSNPDGSPKETDKYNELNKARELTDPDDYEYD